MTLDSFLSKEKSSGGGFQMTEGKFTFQWTVISLLPSITIDWLLYNILCIYYYKQKHSII
jgi:hypothetical protein